MSERHRFQVLRPHFCHRPLPWSKGLLRPLCTESVVHTDHSAEKALNGVLLANGLQVSAPRAACLPQGRPLIDIQLWEGWRVRR